mmetsp:Transcript_974/g.3112  ORF Transcript_974/g.3112 Transcript_974/m.3112 type:complete len:244 (+) Transcript_974:1995-2726(+)
MHLSTRISASRDCDESHCRPSVVETAGACGATTGAVSSATIGAASRAGRCESPPELLVVPCRFFRPSCAARDRFSCRGGSASASSRWSSTSTSARLGCVLAASSRDGSGRAADRAGRAAGASTCCSDDCGSRVSTSSSASEASGGSDLVASSERPKRTGCASSSCASSSSMASSCAASNFFFAFFRFLLASLRHSVSTRCAKSATFHAFCRAVAPMKPVQSRRPQRHGGKEPSNVVRQMGSWA